MREDCDELGNSHCFIELDSGSFPGTLYQVYFTMLMMIMKHLVVYGGFRSYSIPHIWFNPFTSFYCHQNMTILMEFPFPSISYVLSFCGSQVIPD